MQQIIVGSRAFLNAWATPGVAYIIVRATRTGALIWNSFTPLF